MSAGAPTREQIAAAAERKATMGIVLAVLGLIIIPVLGSGLAMLFGYRARGPLREHPEFSDGRAIAAIVLGWVGLVMSSLSLLAWATGLVEV